MVQDDEGDGGPDGAPARDASSRIQGSVAQRGKTRRRGPGSGAVRADRSHRTVLLVDPDRSSRDIYGTLFRHEGYQVIEASNGVEGILLARNRGPDVIVTELFIPDGEGWRIPALLRADPRTASTPILAVTTHAGPEAEARALAAGCDGYLRKPCEPHAVLEKVERLLDARSG